MAISTKLLACFSDNTFARFIGAIGGTAGVALANFALAAFLLQSVAPAQFGVFTFVQVTIAFGCGISNALLGSPLMVALNRLETTIDGIPESYFKASLFISLLASIPVWGTVVLLGESYLTATFFALAAIMMWTRWFGRSYANAVDEPARVAVSDTGYAVIVLAGAFLLFLWDMVTIQTLPLIQIFASFVGLLALGWSSVRVQIAGIRHGSLAPFWTGFQGQGRHALVGVVTTEATTNAHSYIVTLLLGPAAFAPLSASV